MVVYVRAPAVGGGILEATVTAPGVPSDAAHHEWQVKPAGETVSASEAAWIDRDATLSGPASDAGAVAVSPRSRPQNEAVGRNPTSFARAPLD